MGCYYQKGLSQQLNTQMRTTYNSKHDHKKAYVIVSCSNDVVKSIQVFLESKKLENPYEQQHHSNGGNYLVVMLLFTQGRGIVYKVSNTTIRAICEPRKGYYVAPLDYNSNCEGKSCQVNQSVEASKLYENKFEYFNKEPY